MNLKAPIFIHSLFRTGSTYLWNKFRNNDNFHCYYEPFHQVIPKLAYGGPSPWDHKRENTDKMRHPELGKNHFEEYSGLLSAERKTIASFRKAFSFDDFCTVTDDAAARRYIDELLANAAPKTPVLQFNRTAFRTGWFKSNYPSGYHIYLFRNAREQWRSYVSFTGGNKYGNVFLAMDLLIAGVNADKPHFRKLSTHVPLLAFHSDDIETELIFFSKMAELYTDEEKYAIFYYIWLYGLIESARHADMLLSIDRLSCSPDYREKITAGLRTDACRDLGFEDARLPEPKPFLLPPETAENIESKIAALVLDSFDEDAILRFLNLFDNEDMAATGLLPQNLDRARAATAPAGIDTEAIIDRYAKALRFLAETAYVNNPLVKALEDRLASETRAKEQYIHALKNSFSYRIGQLFVLPAAWFFRHFEQLSQRMLNRKNN